MDGRGQRHAGSGTPAELQRHARLDELDAVWISHLHADHSADLLTAYYGALFADVRLAAPIPLYGPPGTADRLAHFLTNTSTRSPVESAFEVHELHDGHQAQVGALTLTSRAVAHGIPASAVRVEAADGSSSLVHSGDTAPCASLTSLAEGAQVHHTPEDAGETARAARSGRLIGTHVGRFLTAQQAVRRAATRFDGPVDYASPGATFPIG
ncbi:MBL fold metallo-hydrolase [Streptomyces sp. NPDC003016]